MGNLLRIIAIAAISSAALPAEAASEIIGNPANQTTVARKSRNPARLLRRLGAWEVLFPEWLSSRGIPRPEAPEAAANPPASELPGSESGPNTTPATSDLTTNATGGLSPQP